MFCINCLQRNTRTTNTRPSKKSPHVWRRRYCPHCNTTFTTYERPSLADNKPVADTAVRFNLGRLIISISDSFTHNTQDGRENALWLAQTIEDNLSLTKEPLTLNHIATTTYKVLKYYDELAALQYAAKHRLISSVRRRGRPSLREREQLNGE